jgi:carbon-monoxide dehydrogenase medium subunit
MKPRAFEYYAPRTVDEALELLVEHGEDARPLAGGQSLVPLMNLRMASPGVLIDLNRIPALSYIETRDDHLAIGAMTRYCEVESAPIVQERFPVVIEATREVGYIGVRSRGTIGGALAHADPVAEWPCLALALDARMVCAGPGGRRVIAAADFFVGMYETALDEGELLVEVQLPLYRDADGWAFQEFARKTGDYALVAVVVLIGSHEGTITRARVALSNLDERPVRARRVEAALEGLALPAGMDASRLRADLAAEHPLPDELEMRRDIAGTLLSRAVTEALARTEEGS